MNEKTEALLKAIAKMKWGTEIQFYTLDDQRQEVDIEIVDVNNDVDAKVILVQVTHP